MARDVLDLDPEEIELWCKALRDDDIIKNKGSLISPTPLEWIKTPEPVALRWVDTQELPDPYYDSVCVKRGYAYCFLGVAGKQLFNMTDGDLRVSSTSIPQVRGPITNIMVKLNDSSDLSLSRLADVLEAFYRNKEDVWDWWNNTFGCGNQYPEYRYNGNPHQYECILQDMVHMFAGIKTRVKIDP